MQRGELHDEFTNILEDLFIVVHAQNEHITKMHDVSIHANKRLIQCNDVMLCNAFVPESSVPNARRD